MSQAVSINFTTSSLPEAARLTINFAGNVQISQLEPIKGIVAVAMGVQPTRLLNGLATNQTNALEEIIGSTFQWDLPAYRNVEGPEPLDVVTLSDDEELLISGLLVN